MPLKMSRTPCRSECDPSVGWQRPFGALFFVLGGLASRLGRWRLGDQRPYLWVWLRLGGNADDSSAVLKSSEGRDVEQRVTFFW